MPPYESPKGTKSSGPAHTLPKKYFSVLTRRFAPDDVLAPFSGLVAPPLSPNSTKKKYLNKIANKDTDSKDKGFRVDGKDIGEVLEQMLFVEGEPRGLIDENEKGGGNGESVMHIGTTSGEKGKGKKEQYTAEVAAKELWRSIYPYLEYRYHVDRDGQVLLREVRLDEDAWRYNCDWALVRDRDEEKLRLKAELEEEKSAELEGKTREVEKPDLSVAEQKSAFERQLGCRL